jgi:hypothetical protein
LSAVTVVLHTEALVTGEQFHRLITHAAALDKPTPLVLEGLPGVELTVDADSDEAAKTMVSLTALDLAIPFSKVLLRKEMPEEPWSLSIGQDS